MYYYGYNIYIVKKKKLKKLKCVVFKDFNDVDYK